MQSDIFALMNTIAMNQTPQKSSLPFPRTQKDKFQQVEMGLFYLFSSQDSKKKDLFISSSG
jgi:hypothetical protein